MNQLSLRNNRVKFETLGKISIDVEDFKRIDHKLMKIIWKMLTGAFTFGCLMEKGLF
jgi:hypothetical protein